MLVFSVKDNSTGETVEFSSNPTNLFPSAEEAKKALNRKNSKLKQGENLIEGTVVRHSLHTPVIAGGQR